MLKLDDNSMSVVSSFLNIIESRRLAAVSSRFHNTIKVSSAIPRIIERAVVYRGIETDLAICYHAITVARMVWSLEEQSPDICCDVQSELSFERTIEYCVGSEPHRKSPIVGAYELDSRFRYFIVHTNGSMSLYRVTVFVHHTRAIYWWRNAYGLAIVEIKLPGLSLTHARPGGAYVTFPPIRNAFIEMRTGGSFNNTFFPRPHCERVFRNGTHVLIAPTTGHMQFVHVRKYSFLFNKSYKRFGTMPRRCFLNILNFLDYVDRANLARVDHRLAAYIQPVYYNDMMTIGVLKKMFNMRYFKCCIRPQPHKLTRRQQSIVSLTFTKNLVLAIQGIVGDVINRGCGGVSRFIGLVVPNKHIALIPTIDTDGRRKKRLFSIEIDPSRSSKETLSILIEEFAMHTKLDIDADCITDTYRFDPIRIVKSQCAEIYVRDRILVFSEARDPIHTDYVSEFNLNSLNCEAESRIFVSMDMSRKRRRLC